MPELAAVRDRVERLSPSERRELLKRLALEAERAADAPALDLVDAARRLRSALPPELIPTELVFVSAIPRDEHGNLRLAELPEPDGTRRLPGARGPAPSTPHERVAAEAFCEVLRLEEVDTDSDFFELGGHSMLAIQLLSRLRARSGLRISLGAFLRNPTVAGAASQLGDSARAPGRSRPHDELEAFAVPGRFLVRPEFDTAHGSARSGCAFAVRVAGGERVFVLTALHLVGPLSGLPVQVPGERLDAEVRAVRVRLAWGDPTFAEELGRPIPLRDTAPIGQPSALGDVAVFRTGAQTRLEPLELAAREPGPGDRGWLVAVVDGHSEQTTHAVRFLGKREGRLVYAHEDLEHEAFLTCGSAVLDGEGRVVGVHVTDGVVQGRAIGSATAVVPLLRFLPPELLRRRAREEDAA